MCIFIDEIGIYAHLSHLGFDGVYPIYLIKESKHGININKITFRHAQGLEDPNKIEFV
jgi:hypothetical protein